MRVPACVRKRFDIWDALGTTGGSYRKPPSGLHWRVHGKRYSGTPVKLDLTARRSGCLSNDRSRTLASSREAHGDDGGRAIPHKLWMRAPGKAAYVPGCMKTDPGAFNVCRPTTSRVLRQINRLTMRHHPGSRASAVLRAGWLASRLSWEPVQRLEGDDGLSG
jgi:hypothetical protein